MMFTIEITETLNPVGDADQLVAGLQKLGNGCFATAYASGHDQVVKVGVGNDWGYMSFLEVMSQQHTQNPWLPRIHWVRVFMSSTGRESDNRIVTCMERLERPWSEGGRMVDENNKYNPLWQEYVNICGEIDDHMHSAKDETAWIDRNQELSAALQVVRQAMRACNRTTDMHYGNFMVRGRQLVITDPIGF